MQAPVEPESQEDEEGKKEEEEEGEEVTESEEPLEKVVLDDFSDIMLPGMIIINNKIIINIKIPLLVHLNIEKGKLSLVTQLLHCVRLSGRYFLA